MKRYLMFLLSLCFLLAGIQSYAQKIDLEKTYQITGKSKRGELLDVQRNDAGEYILTYSTRVVDKLKEVKFKFQVYTFDKDFNFINMTDEEVSLEKYRERTKGRYKGETYFVDGNRIAGLPGTALKLKKKRTTYTWSWFYQDYTSSTEVLETVKPRSEDGDKYIVKFSPNSPDEMAGAPFATAMEDDINGDLYFLAGVRNGKIMSKDFDVNEEHTDLHLLKFNKDLDKVGDLQIKFEYPQDVAFFRIIPGSMVGKPDQAIGGGIIIFAPLNNQASNKRFLLDPEKNNFTFVQFDSDCKLVDRISFKPEITGWNIDEGIISFNDNKFNFYVYGPAALGKDKYWGQCFRAGKYKAVQVMKIADGKVQYLTETELPEFESKMKMPPSQKKGDPYIGKKFKRTGFEVASNGDYFITGQKVNKTDGPIYGNMLCFHFDKDGKLKSHYSVATSGEAKYSYLMKESMREINNQMYWTWLESLEQNLVFPSVGKIDIEKGEIQDFLRLGSDGKKQLYYLNPSFPYLDIQGNQTVFFGNDAKGGTIWFCRLNYE